MALKKVTITRLLTDDDGTFGVLTTPGFTCKTLELPWRNNMRGISCIPPGTYECEIVNSPRFGKVYTVNNVPSRSLIRFHGGNFGGDTSKGYVSHIEGCILLGKGFGVLTNKLGKRQRALLVSAPTVRAFSEHLKREPFILTIEPASMEAIHA